MGNQQPREETGRVLSLAAALWGTVIGIAALEGAFARFEASSLAALAAFIALFAVASYFLDPQLRTYATRIDAPRASALALALIAALAAALELGSAPFAMFFAPFAALSAVAALGHARPRARAMSASPAKSPGANPAAT